MGAKVRVLSFDGGGIRGVISARVLMHVEEILQEISGDKDARLSDFFDLVSGTSTGGILTALVLAPDKEISGRARYSAADMLDLYLNHGQEIFTKSVRAKYLDRFGLLNPLYAAEPIEKILNDYLGDLKISELLRPCLIPAYNIDKGRATFFSGLEVRDNPKRDRYVRDVLRMTSAAPTYFPPAKIGDDAYIDGGIFANNPALCAYIEAIKFPADVAPSDIMMLSIGTGSTSRHYDYKRVKDWGRLEWIKPIIDIYSSSAAQTVNHQLEVLYDKKDRTGNYLRIEPNLDKFKVDKGMDAATVENMDKLVKVGETINIDYDIQLRKFLRKIYESNRLSPYQKLYETSDDR